MFPQPGEGSDPPQPLPPWLPWRGLHQLPCGHGAGSPAALQAGLCQHPEEVVCQRLQDQQRQRHGHLESEGDCDSSYKWSPTENGLLWTREKSAERSSHSLITLTTGCCQITEELWASLHTTSNLTSFVRQEFVHLTQTIMHTLGEPKVPIHFMLNSFRINCPYPSTILRLHVNASFNSIHIKTNSANSKISDFYSNTCK